MDEKMNDLSPQMEETEDDAVMSPDTYSEETEKIATKENEDATEDEDGFSEPIRESQIEDDMEELKKQFPELSGISSPSELQGAEKYMRFRELGLSPTEAYLAIGGGRIKERPRPTSPVSVRRRDDGIPDRQLRMARELFSEMSDTEIQALYRRVTK